MKLNHTQKNLIIVASIISAVLGLLLLYPSLNKESYLLTAFCLLAIVAGIIGIAIAFGD